MKKFALRKRNTFLKLDFNSSPVTKGVSFRPQKPDILRSQNGKGRSNMALSTYQDFFNEKYAKGVLDQKTKHLIALGASLAAGCEP